MTKPMGEAMAHVPVGARLSSGWHAGPKPLHGEAWSGAGCTLSTEATQNVSQLITETEPKGRHVPSLSGHLLCELSDLLFQ